MIGFLTEHGPFRATKNGEGLVKGEFAWNQLANMVFIEQPVGVGFSQSDRPETYNDENAAEDNRKFIVGFFKKFPELKSTPFYISSESYGGHYMPTLAKNILDHPGSVPNFKGLLVGNPYVWAPNNDLGEFETLAGHQLIPGPLAGLFTKNGCNIINVYKVSPVCRLIFVLSRQYEMGLDPYAMDFPVCNDKSALQKILHENRLKQFYQDYAMRHELGSDSDIDYLLKEASIFFEKLKSGNPIEVKDSQNDNIEEEAEVKPESKEEVKEIPSKITSETSRRTLQYFPNAYEPCAENYAVAYLNRADVQKAIHAQAPKIGKYQSCSDKVGYAYSRVSANANMIPIYDSLMGKIKITIFSGDDDTVCATAGLQHWIWKYNVVTRWQQWRYADDKGGVQVGGYYVSFSKTNGTNADFHVYTVHGAGHMVPSTRPHAGFEILKRFLRS